MGQGRTANFASLPLQSSPQDGKSFTCSFPMPFAHGMRMTIETKCEDEVLFYYYVNLELLDRLGSGLGRFHAQWRRVVLAGETGIGMTNGAYQLGGINPDGRDNHTILEATGHGHSVGCLLSVYSLRRSPDWDWDWYGEGDDMIFIDGEPGLVAPEVGRTPQIAEEQLGSTLPNRPESREGANDAWPPTPHGTRTEDSFNTSWCPDQECSAPYHGIISGGGPN